MIIIAAKQIALCCQWRFDRSLGRGCETPTRCWTIYPDPIHGRIPVAWGGGVASPWKLRLLRLVHRASKNVITVLPSVQSFLWRSMCARHVDLWMEEWIIFLTRKLDFVFDHFFIIDIVNPKVTGIIALHQQWSCICLPYHTTFYSLTFL